MFDKLDFITEKYNELAEKVADPAVIADQKTWQKHMKEMSEIEPIVKAYEDYRKMQSDLADARELIDLEDDEELMAIFNEANVSLQSGWRRDSDTGESHLYGIPAARLPGLDRYAYAENGFLSVLISGGNDENTLKFLRILCSDMIIPPAE